MAQSSYVPKAYLLDPTAYIDKYLQQAGANAAAEHTYVYSPTTTYDANNPEMKLYAQWLQQSGVSDQPTFFGQAAWSAMRLFTETAFKVGPHLTRAAMISALKKVDNWTDNGMHSVQHVGAKKTGPCTLILQVTGSQFNKIAPPGDGYLCGALVHT
jgi:hypothetical protein